MARNVICSGRWVSETRGGWDGPSVLHGIWQRYDALSQDYVRLKDLAASPNRASCWLSLCIGMLWISLYGRATLLIPTLALSYHPKLLAMPATRTYLTLHLSPPQIDANLEETGLQSKVQPVYSANMAILTQCLEVCDDVLFGLS